MSIKAYVDKTKTYQNDGKLIYKTNPTLLKFDDIEKGTITQKDGKIVDMYKVSFIEEIVWCTPDKPEEILTTMKNYICSYNNLEFNKLILDNLTRGDEVNAVLEFKLGKDKDGNPIWFQAINRIEKANTSVHPTNDSGEEEVEVPIENPESEEKTKVYTEKPDEDSSLPPVASFKLPITYHDRTALSIQRQKSVEFALEYIDIMAKNDLGIDEEVAKFIWDGIQELWRDVPRIVENEENSEK